MTYLTGGQIDAADYNAFVASINTTYGDTNSGQSSLPAAGYGYGQSTLSTVAANNTITAVQWSSLFDNIRSTGTHQGTTVAPPVPVANPVAGGNIIAYNSSAMSTTLATLQTNRFNIAAGQFTQTSNLLSQTSAVWKNTLTFSTSVTFGSWNNARYFFNSGGSVRISASYSPSSTLDDASWVTMMSTMGTISVPYSTFYGLTASYTTLYQGFGPAGPYSTSYILVQAKLNAAPGLATGITIQITLVDNDSGSPTFKQNKNGITVYNIANNRSTSAVVIALPGISGTTFVST